FTPRSGRPPPSSRHTSRRKWRRERGMSESPPIIRKVKKKGGHGHHGGSWKVAYADFVTAMMAFFLLLWLLSTVDEEKREQVAMYFQRPVSAIFESGSNPTGNMLLNEAPASSGPGMLVAAMDSA